MAAGTEDALLGSGDPKDLAGEAPAEEAVEDTVEDAAEDAVEDPSEPDEPVNVKSVETVSAMDLIMGAAGEQSSEGNSESDEDTEGPASA